MDSLVVFVEEESAKELLMRILPCLVPEGTQIRVIAFEGKSDLESQLARKLRNWQNPSARFVVLRDQDSGNCIEVKERLKELCRSAGKSEALVRIACHELESWYLGDLEAVGKGLSLPGITRSSDKAKFRDPDRLNNASQELKTLTRGIYQKISGSRRIAPHMDLAGRNRSTSFNIFCSGVRRLCGA